MATRILGIDPGTIRLGFALLEAEGSRARYLRSGTLRAPSRAPYTERLALLHRQLQVVVDTELPQCIALESAFHGRNVKALIRLGEARGMVIGLAGSRSIPVCDYSPAVIKKAVTGNGNASKQSVARMVCLVLGIGPSRDEETDLDPRSPSGDETDAIAAGLCHLHRLEHAQVVAASAAVERSSRAQKAAGDGERTRASATADRTTADLFGLSLPKGARRRW